MAIGFLKAKPGQSLALRRNRAIRLGALAFVLIRAAMAQLDDSCVVSVLNRNILVKPDGTWALPNVPANFGPVRARATCVRNGQTTSGQSDFLVIPPNGSVNVPPIILGNTTPIPVALSIVASTGTLTQPNAILPLTVIATYPDNSSKNVTSATSGTQYRTSNPDIATISAEGLVTARKSGNVVIQAVNEGTPGLFSLAVVLTSDTDGDGIPDDAEIRLGLNPNDPNDARQDLDHDGLTNVEEYRAGTDMRNPDSDGDGLTDGDEVKKYHTNPLIYDTDGDGVGDGLEISNGTDSLNAGSYNFAKALSTIAVLPPSFTLDVSSTSTNTSQQLAVTGQLTDGHTVDLTSTAKGTNYSSSNLNVCNFGAPDGKLFAGLPGPCTITVSNSGFQAQSIGTVTSSTPTGLSFVAIPGYANSVAVNGNYAYIAAGSAGLQVVDVSDRANPRVVAGLPLQGNANSIVIHGPYAFVASGVFGLQIVDIAHPLTPVFVGHYMTSGEAWDVVVKGTTAYVAAGASGLQMVDVSSPAFPFLVGAVAVPGTAKGVDVDTVRKLAVVAAGTGGLQVINVAVPSSPSIVGAVALNDARDLALAGNYAMVAAFQQSLVSIDLTAPSNPVIRYSAPGATGGYLNDVVLARGFALGADVFFVNGVPVIDVTTPETPVPRVIIDFSRFRDDNATGIAADATYVYFTAARDINENGVSGDTRLYIGQYAPSTDTGGVGPTVSIANPSSGSSYIASTLIPLGVQVTDDVAVASVTYLMDGQPVFTSTTPPWDGAALGTLTGSAPRTVTLTARANDLGGNSRTSNPVTVTIVPDPLTSVTGKAMLSATSGSVVLPNQPTWGLYKPGTSTAAITAANPRSGNGSLELRNTDFNGAALIYSPDRENGLGPFKQLNALSFEWALATDSVTKASPDLALRIYPYGDTRSFFMDVTPCTSNCAVGPWQFSNVLGQLQIQAADGNTPPSSIAAIPADAPVSEIHIRAAYPFNGTPYHGYFDNLTIGFQGQPNTTFNFEASKSTAVSGPVPGATVNVFNRTTTSDATGNFQFTGVPTVNGPVLASANGVVNGLVVAGTSSPTAPVPNGTTNAGNVILAPISGDVVADFSIASNPNGDWTYGYSSTLGGPFRPLSFPSSTPAGNGNTLEWDASATQRFPLIQLFPGAAWLNIHPGSDASYIVVRWTARFAGKYTITGAFRGNDPVGATSDAHIRVNGTTEVFTAPINGYRTESKFLIPVTVTPGTAVDFAVGIGSNGTFNNDSTGLIATIVQTP